jgi:soluble lytic murein transglycosylase
MLRLTLFAAFAVSGGMLLGSGVAAGDPVEPIAESTAVLPPGDLRFDPSTFEAVLPDPLRSDDVARYRKAFDLQDEGRWHEADGVIDKLRDRTLVGTLLAQRYLHPTAWISKYKDLRAWLEEYADHPDATRIHRLANARHTAGAKPPRAPSGGYLNGSGARAVTTEIPAHVSTRTRSAAQAAEIDQLQSQVRSLVRRGQSTTAAALIERRHTVELLDSVELAEQRFAVSQGLFGAGEDVRALELGSAAAKVGAPTVIEANWVAGLAAWRLGKIDLAGSHFEVVARAEMLSPWVRAAGAYWASRANLVQRRPQKATVWLAQAAVHRDTFYGLLARRALGVGVPVDWSLPPVSHGAVAGIMEQPAGRRALALLQIGQDIRAEREMRKLYGDLDSRYQPALMSIAARHGMPGLAMRIAGLLRAAGHRPYYAALYPAPDWGRDVDLEDRALIFAIVRQESQFDPRATSQRGARGLMQLMPSTAALIGEDNSLKAEARHVLYDPTVNMQLGQSYFHKLIEMDGVQNDLFNLLAAYNAGPGNLRKWRRNMDVKDDPLLFVEALPSRETRDFIERVLANLWMYRLQFRQPIRSLDLVAAGGWPLYPDGPGSQTEILKNARY